MLTEGKWREVMAIVRQAVEEGKEQALSFLYPPGVFGVFVTLRYQGNLRGCMGELDFEKLKREAVSQAASAAAFRDPRFLPLRKEERPLECEVSFLYDLKAGEDLKNFIPGQDGLLVEYKKKRGLFLPKVALEHGWDGYKAYEMLCREKIGMSEEEMRDPEVKYFFFKVESWIEIV